MGRRSKQIVRHRAKAHQKRVKAGHKTRVRARARGLHPASKRRKARATRRARRAK
jgi:hypothetical protein